MLSLKTKQKQNKKNNKKKKKQLQISEAGANKNNTVHKTGLYLNSTQLQPLRSGQPFYIIFHLFKFEKHSNKSESIDN